MQNTFQDQEILNAVHAAFADGPFNEDALTAVRHYVTFRLNEADRKSGVPYNILLLCDDTDRCKDFIARMDRALVSLRKRKLTFLRNPEPAFYTEEQLLADPNIVYEAVRKYSILAITDLNEEEADNWGAVKEAIERTPDQTKVLCVSSEIADKRLRSDEHLYNRIFAHSNRLALSDPDNDEIFTAFVNKLKVKGYALSTDFETEIHDYIDTVYPTATLRKAAFLDDLYARVITLLFRETIPNDMIPASCVPFYRKKNMTIEKSETESVETAPDHIEEDEIAADSPVYSAEHSSLTDPQKPVLAKGSKKQHTCNVLLMALSTFSIKENTTYTYTENGVTYTGPYDHQMEPVARMLSKLLASQEDTLDKIILLCTAGSQTPQIQAIRGTAYTISPKDFFIENMKDWLNPDIEEKFIPITVDENDPYGGIAETVKVIREIKDCPDSGKLQLYMDSHGSFRIIQYSLQAIISLLSQENIEVSEYYDVRFSGSTATITNQTATFQLFDFVSGINEFINYGRIQSLERYFEKLPKNATTEKLLHTIKEIAESIQLCEINQFQAGLKSLADFYNNIDTDREVDAYLSLFTENIRHDYQNLLKLDHTTLDEIQWCLDKGFYQQCLTLIEARIPQILSKKGIMKYGNRTKSYGNAVKKHNELNGLLLSKIMYDETLGFDGDANKNDQQCRAFLCDHPDISSYERDLRNASEKVDIPMKFEIIPTKRELAEHKDITGSYSLVFEAKTPALQLKLNHLLILHHVLKTMRNNSNHASAGKKPSREVPLSNLKAAIQTYVWWGREIILRETVDWSKYEA